MTHKQPKVEEDIGMKSHQGFFISFEGGEGAGKSTQIILLARHLEQRAKNVLTTREPGGSKGAEAVRHALLSGRVEKYGVAMEALLFAAARADHVETLIKPALNQGKIVLCDRFIDSSRVYQGRAGGEGGNLPPSYISLLEKATIQNIMPDLTFILDLPVAEGLERAQARRLHGEAADRFEKEDRSIHEERRQAFLDIAAAEPQRCLVINGARAAVEIADEIAYLTDARLREKQL